MRSKAWLAAHASLWLACMPHPARAMRSRRLRSTLAAAPYFVVHAIVRCNVETFPLTGDFPVGMFVQRSVDDQLDVVDSQNKDVVIYSYIFMFGYIVLALGRFPHPVKTRISLGLQGILIVAGSAAGAIGIVSVAGAC